MKLTISRAVASLAVVAASSGALLISGGSAHATTTPPWEPDSSSVGGLVFYNSSGAVITGGSITDQPLAAYVEGTSAIRAGDTKATLYGYLPISGQVPGQWQGEALSASTTYPNSSAPAPIKTSTLPVVSGTADDENLSTLEADYPNTDTSTTDGYKGMYQLRLKSTAPSQPANVTYDSADILITGSTWSVAYSAVPATATSTTLDVTPPSKAFHDATVALTATVSPSAATGSVQFLDGTKLIKSVAVVSGSASTSTTTLSDGTHSLTAKFVPDSDAYLTSTSSSHSLKVSAHPTTTTLKASTKSVKKGKKVKLTATETPAAAGKITFLDGKKSLGKVKVKKGKATLTTKLSKGKHKLTAKFTPSDPQTYASSTSKKVKVKAKG